MEEYNEGTRLLYEEYQRMDRIVDDIVGVHPEPTQKTSISAAWKQYDKWRTIIGVLRPIFPININSTSYSEAHSNYVFKTGRCFNGGVRHYAPETYCYSCTELQARLYQSWMEDVNKTRQ